jgi:hypothetical protein
VRLIRSFVFLVVLVWIVVEVAAIPVADRMVATQVEAQIHDVSRVTASVGSFPLVTRFLLTGRVSKAAITMTGVQRLPLSFAQVRFDLSGVQIDRTRLIRQRKAHITAVDRATITATVDRSTLPAGLGRLAARVSGRTLVVGAASFRLASDVLPCDPSVTVGASDVVLSCTIDHVPPVFLEDAQR